MLSDRLKRGREEEGFSLIELLVVIAIIGILAAIAIAVFSNQRNSARDASVKSDLNQAAKVVETYYVTNQLYPSDATVLADPNTINLSPGNQLYYEPVTGGFLLYGCNTEAGVNYTYDSLNGGLQSTTTDGGCADAPAGATQINPPGA